MVGNAAVKLMKRVFLVVGLLLVLMSWGHEIPFENQPGWPQFNRHDASVSQTGPIAQVVNRASSAVINIKIHRRSHPGPMGGWNSLWNNLFGSPPGQSDENSIGSGFFIREDGYLVTNQHVIEGARQVTIHTMDHKEYQAQIVGQDREMDLAILKVRGQREFPPLRLGNSDLMQVGEWVIAIGNPYGLEQTVTVGVVSAKGRPIRINNRIYKDLIQTDAAINPGNSGGPLLNIQGEVVGINTAVNSQAQGIGFAIPINAVKDVMDELIKHGRMIRPYLGIYVHSSPAPVSGESGPVVVHIVRHSPAHKAGIREADQVIRYNEVSVRNPLHFEQLLKHSQIGDQITLDLRRKGKLYTRTLTVMEKP